MGGMRVEGRASSRACGSYEAVYLSGLNLRPT